MQQKLSTATFTGLGGHDMERAGQHRIVRAEDVAVMGVTEILRHIPRIYMSYRRLVAHIKKQRPDVAVLIDFPDVNFRLAKLLARAGVPVIWFVSPQLWAWKRSRLRWVQQRVSKMLVIFPFEQPFYEARGVDAEFVGHPLATDLQVHSTPNIAIQKVLDDIHSVVEAARKPGHAPQKAVIGSVDGWITKAARKCGLDIEGYHHIIDGSAVRHVLNRHGNAAIEASRGQLPIGPADFDKILEVVLLPDRIVLGTKTLGRRDQIGYIKRLEDGTTLYLEEIRTGKKALATVSMRKYPAARDFDAIADTLPSNARSDGGNTPILVHPPESHKDDAIHTPYDEFISREAFAAQHSLDPAKQWIALLPGSRWKEVRANLHALHELAVNDLFSASAAHTTFDGRNTTAPRDPAAHTRYEFLLPVASTIDPTALRQYLTTLNAAHLRYFDTTPTTDTKPRITLITGPDAARDSLHHARASVVASGTATVLAALVGNPFVVVYRVSALTFALAKKLVRYPREIPAHIDAHGNLPVAMVNLIAGRRIVPELLQENFTAVTVAAALTPLLKDTPTRNAQIAALAEVRHRLTLPGPSTPMDRVADAVLSLLS